MYFIFCSQSLQTTHKNLLFGEIIFSKLHKLTVLLLKVTCYGQIIGAVVAVNQSIAQKAARMVEVQYEDLKPLIISIEVKEIDFLMKQCLAKSRFLYLWSVFHKSRTPFSTVPSLTKHRSIFRTATLKKRSPSRVTFFREKFELGGRSIFTLKHRRH